MGRAAKFIACLLLAAAWCAGCGGHSQKRGEAGADAVTRTALAQTGRPYHYGGTSPQTGFDCSGFTQWVYRQQGVSLPREVADQFQRGRKVDRASLREGDLVFFDLNGRGPSHVGIYLGRGAFIHSPSTGGKIRRNSLDQKWWAKRYAGARRVLE